MWLGCHHFLRRFSDRGPHGTVRPDAEQEVVEGLKKKDAVFEAKRCLSCGNCFECDGCLGACPEHAISKRKKHKGYKIDFDKCTGCAICFEQCPCHALEMIPEPA